MGKCGFPSAPEVYPMPPFRVLGTPEIWKNNEKNRSTNKNAKRGAKIGQEVARMSKVRPRRSKNSSKSDPGRDRERVPKPLGHKNAELSANAIICYE